MPLHNALSNLIIFSINENILNINFSLMTILMIISTKGVKQRTQYIKEAGIEKKMNIHGVH